MISVQKKFSVKRPGLRVSFCLCIVQQVRGEKCVVEFAEKSSLQSQLREESHSIFVAGRMQSYNFCEFLLNKASLCPFPALQTLEHRNICQKNETKL